MRLPHRTAGVAAVIAAAVPAARLAGCAPPPAGTASASAGTASATAPPDVPDDRERGLPGGAGA